ncbi:RDD family protein [Kingella kingae]|uniref:RDD family protein n=1 Tax=Kingella kingae TaxID=504 RepID=UPI0002586906|nr:RDD family protein [Kingella kingae]EIC13164.1 hypothetical protein KKB_07524 [Kingella kingae PYKK081]MDK4567837.1 RDD family protein [Kingella kingae]MDK4570049.1 RDD family protein [Kingella kingae]MDK4571932.1 RDD family protein [Kingella kingae]MDK4599533.1 RDD family protein [Kingella kingae]
MFTPAPLRRRLFALCYESLLVGSVSLLAGLFVGGILTLLPSAIAQHNWFSSLLTVLILLGSWWLYFRLNWQREGQTLPMRVWKIGLSDKQSSLHPHRSVLLRRYLWACVFLVFIPLLAYQTLRYQGIAPRSATWLSLFWWILPWGFALLNRRRQFLYDYLAGTELVDLRER